MLTPEEETARALKASQLYGKPLPSELKKAPPPSFIWKPAIVASVFLTIPFLFVMLLLSIYLSFVTISLSDFQAASLLLIVLMMAALLLTIACLRYFRQVLYKNYLGIHVSFWISFLALCAIAYAAFIAINQGKDTTITTLIHVGIFDALFVPVAVVWTTLVVYVCDRLARR
jgi:hypothetical protein